MSGMSPSPAGRKLHGRQFGNQLGPRLMFSVELCASLLEMQQQELALYALRQGFARINISHVELRDKHRIGVVLFYKIAMLPCPNIPDKVDAWTRWAGRTCFLGQHGTSVSVELCVLCVGLPVKKQVELACETLQRL